MRRYLVLTIFALTLGLTAQVPAKPGLYAQLQTSKGPILLVLYPDSAPIAVASFVGLAEGTIANPAMDPGQPFYDGSVFHRVVPGHVIQTGIPNSTRAKNPGYEYPNEIDARRSHDHAGAVGIANGGPNTNAAQFYITLGDRSYLDGDYSVIGDVVTGMDAVMQVRQGDVLNSVRILRVGARANAYHPTTASFQALLAAGKAQVAREAELKAAAEQAWIKKHYPHATPLTNGVLLQRTVAGSGATPAARFEYTGVALRWEGDWLHRSGPALAGMPFVSTANGKPGLAAAAGAAFDDAPGAATINPGLDAALATLHAGDHAVVIVPAAAAYKRSGFYAPSIPGQPRFHIPPDCMLVYTVTALP